MELDNPVRLASPWRSRLVALALWLLVAASASLGLWQLRRESVASQTRELNLLSLALTDEIERGLRGAEEGLRAMRAELREGRLPLSGASATLALRTRADLMPLIQALWLVGRGGRVLQASDDLAAPDLNAFAPALADLSSDAIALSKAFVDTQRNEALVALAVRVDELPAVEGRWIVAALPSSTLLGAFNAALSSPDARMLVFRSDGAQLASANASPAWIDAVRLAQRAPERGGIQLRSLPDGRELLVGMHDIPRYGLTVVLTRELSVVLQSWRQAAEGAAAALAVMLAVMLAGVRFVRRAELRRAQAQQDLQAQVMRASKLESLGTLAGGVAHDFNNVLAGIVGFGEMAREAAAPGSDQARHIDKVLKAALRGKALVERILAFSRGGARASAVFELEPVVEEVLALLAASLRPGVVLERVLEAAGARLRGDPTQAYEAVMNLCTNAMQAMPRGGMLSVRLRRERVAAARVLSHSAVSAGDHLVLTIADQGQGITPEVMEHLFEPFFTTRDAHSGTGLGLAVVHGVVAEFKGGIDVRSTPGQGACFTVYLPECMEPLAVDEPGGGTTPARGAGQAVLVVDDEAELVNLEVEMLRGLGFAPEGCIDAAAALHRLRERPGHFAALITDEVMPAMSGTQLTAIVRGFAPRLPVLLLSGYGGAMLAQRAAVAGVTRVLAKPLRRDDLARALAELLQ